MLHILSSGFPVCQRRLKALVCSLMLNVPSSPDLPQDSGVQPDCNIPSPVIRVSALAEAFQLFCHAIVCQSLF